jgi:glyoxylase-like metal-dependent hydrolase (beta-lactamase superfamily II)
MSRILYRFMAILFLVYSYVFSQVQSEPETYPYIKLTDNLYKIEVDANSIVGSIGSDRVLLCDVGGESKAPRLLATIRALVGEKIDNIIDTDWHVDHTGGNIYLKKKQ